MTDRHRAQVVVLGAGVSGLATAWHLRKHEGVTDVTVVADRVSRGGTGLCQIGLMDHLNRVAHGVGEEAAIQIWRYSAEGVRVAEALAHAVGSEVTASGSYLAATREAERADLEASLPLLERAGFATRAVAEPLDGDGGRPRVLAALFEPTDLTLRPPHILPRLVRRLERDGVRFVFGARAAEVRLEEHGVSVRHADGTCEAEICVVACGAQARDVYPFFRERVLPIVAQGFSAVLPLGGEGVLGAPCSASWGHEVYMVRGSTFVAAGVRPDAEVADLSVPCRSTEAFQRFLRGFARERVPRLPEPLEIERTYAGVIAYPADGLPLIGPLPGAPRVLAATGFGFRGIALAAAAGRSLARLIAGGGSDIPSSLSPRRFL